MLKYKWKVQPEPTGRYRSFDKRGWPDAMTPDDECIAVMYCDDDYVPMFVKSGKHAPIRLRVRIATDTSWRWASLKGEWATLDEAKEAFARFIAQNPEHDFALPVNPS